MQQISTARKSSSLTNTFAQPLSTFRAFEIIKLLQHIKKSYQQHYCINRNTLDANEGQRLTTWFLSTIQTLRLTANVQTTNYTKEPRPTSEVTTPTMTVYLLS